MQLVVEYSPLAKEAVGEQACLEVPMYKTLRKDGGKQDGV